MESASNRELERISMVAEQRRKRLNQVLQEKIGAVIDELGIDAERKLTKREAALILEILGIELNIYQKIELEITVDRSHTFNSQSLKGWIMKYRNFVMCKIVDKKSNEPIDTTEEKEIVERKGRESVLPDIKASKHSQLSRRSCIRERVSMDSYMELIKRNKNMKVRFGKALGNVVNSYKARSGSKGESYRNTVKKRINNSTQEYKRSFIRNVELLSLMQKNCGQMQRFRKLMLTGITTPKNIPFL